jgi:putative MATE family efflux protein
MAKMSGRDITEGSIWKNLLLYFFPIWFGSIFQQMYTTIDAVIVGRFVGKEALAALGGTSSLLVDLSVGFFIGASAGAGVVISHCYGAKDNERLRYAVRTSMLLALICGVALMVVGIFGTPTALRWMNTPADVMASARLYLRVYFCGIIPSLLYNMGSGILRAIGDAKRPLRFLIFTTVVNVGLDILFVAVLNMDIFGAALATVMAQTASAVLVLRTLLRTEEGYRLVLSAGTAYPEILKKIGKVGLPSGFQYTLYTIANLVVQAQVNRFGTDVSAAWAAVSRLDGVFWLTMTAFGTAMTTFTGQNYGAGKMDRVHRGMKVGIVISVLLTAGICFPILLFSRPLLGLFTTDATVLALGLEYTFFLIPTYFTYTGTELIGGVIKGCGNSFGPMVITGISVFGIRSLWALLAPLLWPGMNAVMLSYPVSWCVSTTLFIIYYRWIKQKGGL